MVVSPGSVLIMGKLEGRGQAATHEELSRGSLAEVMLCGRSVSFSVALMAL